MGTRHSTIGRPVERSRRCHQYSFGLEAPRSATTVRPSARAAGLAAELAPIFRAIARDRRHGASYLGLRGIRAFRRWLARAPRSLKEIPSGEFRTLSVQLRTTQPGMGVFRSWSDEFRSFARGKPVDRHVLAKWARRWEDRLGSEIAAAAACAASDFPPNARVLTLSYSDAVLTTLRSIRGSRRPLLVRVLRSRPGGEGARLERALRDVLPTELLGDENVGGAVADSDLVLFGADAVLRDGALIHKINTRRTAEAAHRASVPALVVTGLSKCVDRTRPWKVLPPRFDRTPPRLLTAFWTDGGLLRPDEIASAARRLWLASASS